MASDVARKNKLIKQGRLLRDQPEKAEMTLGEWFAEYEILSEEGEFLEEQAAIVKRLASVLTSVQLARQSRESNAASA
ncbi:MAG: hypothetical protein WDN47_03825 [Candidatus Doudnabacteria bacterium]